MVTTTRSVTPVVSLAKHSAKNWPATDRAACAARCEALGATLTEVSDLREIVGLPRLSEASGEARRVAHLILLGSRGRRALARVRAERVDLLEGLSSCDRGMVRRAAWLLSLRQPPARLRLGELRALYAQTRVCEISREQR